jgi:site-specific DNA recombinase
MKATSRLGPIRCAVYTRKSTEEGLEQAFNSLDAQREACEAYALSQRHEGWQVLDTRYDDGGWSGGNITRPALQRLLSDIKVGLVDLVVVYKIDRLTRSLMDFSKLVEVFDAHNASFVSVTQQFSTTSSMGRLTLNVLLSFAQFEREVTGERIRDKIAASKRKGMWMGGTAPLGYELADKKLVVHKEEAALVTRIYTRYLALGNVHDLKRELDQAGTQGRLRLQRDATTRTVSFSRGGLYAILNRRAYLGEVHHHGEYFTGLHTPIVPAELWQQVQAKLQLSRRERTLGTHCVNGSLLASMVVDGAGHRLMATHTNKAGKRYRYYLLREGDQEDKKKGDKRLCLPAHDVERIATEQWLLLLRAPDLDTQLGVADSNDSATLRINAQHLAQQWAGKSVPKQREAFMRAGFQVTVKERHVEVSAQPEQLAALLLKCENVLSDMASHTVRRVSKSVDAALIKTAGEARIIEEETRVVAATLPNGHQALLKVIAQARAWAASLIAGELATAEEIALASGMSMAQVGRGLKCLNITPDLVERLAQGKGSSALTLAAIRPIHATKWDGLRERWRAEKLSAKANRE